MLIFSEDRVMTAGQVKYVVHVIVFIAWIFLFQRYCGAWSDSSEDIDFDPFEKLVHFLSILIKALRYGTFATLFLYALRLSSLLVLPQCICNMLGLILFNGFKERVTLKATPLLAPLVCFRVVTKGDYPELVKVLLFSKFSKVQHFSKTFKKTWKHVMNVGLKM